MKFILLTESVREEGNGTRLTILPIDMIKFIQDGNDSRDTYVAFRDKNEVGKQKYIFVKETVAEIAAMKPIEW